MTTTQTTNLAGLQARMRTSSPPGWPPTGSPWSPLLVAPRAGAPADKIGSRPPMFLDLAMRGAGLIWSALSAASAPGQHAQRPQQPQHLIAGGGPVSPTAARRSTCTPPCPRDTRLCPRPP